MQLLKPMIRAAAERYVAEKKQTMRDCAKELAAAPVAVKTGAPAPAKAAPKK